MKLAVSYNIFDEVDLLPYAIKEIRAEVGFILVNFQYQSYFGDKLDHYEEYYNKLYNRYKSVYNSFQAMAYQHKTL